MARVGQNHTFIGIYGVHTVFLAGILLYIQSYTVQIYGSGQPRTWHTGMWHKRYLTNTEHSHRPSVVA